MFVASEKDLQKGVPGGSVLRSPPAVLEPQEMRLSPWVGKVPGEGSGNPLQYSCLENAMDEKSLAGYSPRGGPESDTTEVARYKHVKAVDQKLIPGAGSFLSVESLWRIAGLLLIRDKASVLFEREWGQRASAYILSPSSSESRRGRWSSRASATSGPRSACRPTARPWAKPSTAAAAGPAVRPWGQGPVHLNTGPRGVCLAPLQSCLSTGPWFSHLCLLWVFLKLFLTG